MSNAHGKLKQWLQELGQHYGATFPINSRGECELTHGSHNLLISAPEQSSSIYFLASLFKVSYDKQVQVLRSALIQNRTIQTVSGAAVALDPNSDTLTLSYRRNADSMHFTDFINIISNLMENAKQVTQTIGEGAEAQTPPSNAVEIPFDISMRV